MPVVCLDPGHGGRDSGAVGASGLREADVVLDVAFRVGRHLSGLVGVAYTRTEDEWVAPGVVADLRRRCQIASEVGADIFVSIHANAAENTGAVGIETFHYYNSEQGKLLAEAVHSELIAFTGAADRGVKEKGFYVLKCTKMPATLVEMGFLSNPAEERLLALPQYRELCALAIARGICRYFGIEVKPLFKDIENHWARKWIERAYALGLVEGEGGGRFNPDDQITRAQTVVLVMRLFDLLRKQEENRE